MNSRQKKILNEKQRILNKIVKRLKSNNRYLDELRDTLCILSHAVDMGIKKGVIPPPPEDIKPKLVYADIVSKMRNSIEGALRNAVKMLNADTERGAK